MIVAVITTNEMAVFVGVEAPVPASSLCQTLSPVAYHYCTTTVVACVKLRASNTVETPTTASYFAVHMPTPTVPTKRPASCPSPQCHNYQLRTLHLT